jgi:RES domain-containing protein
VTQIPEAEQTVTLYKALYKDYQDDPLPSRSAVGRFHDEETASSTSYLAASLQTAWAEVRYRWNANKEAYRMAEVRVRVRNIVDLTDPVTRRRYGIDETTLIADEHRPCQQLRKRLEAEGVEALWTYSRADQPAGRQLVVLQLHQLQEGSTIEVVHTGPINV